MNLINNQGVIQNNANQQIAGLVPGSNILVNGQMLSIGQLGGLTMSQLQVNAGQNVTMGSVQPSVALTNVTPTVSRGFQNNQQLLLQVRTCHKNFLIEKLQISVSNSMSLLVPSSNI